MKNKNTFFFGPVLLFVAWLAIAQLRLVDSFFLPGPIETIAELARLFYSGAIVSDVFSTLLRLALAFAIALLFGLPLGLLLGSSKRIYESVEFIVDFFRSVPATALFPLFLLVFGIGDEAKVAVAAFAAALIILFNTAYGVMNSKKARVFAARLMGATKLQVFGFVSFWESLPQTIVGIRTALSLALVVIIVTEMFIGTSSGLGHRIIDAQYVYNIKEMYAVILLTGIIGYLLNAILIFVETRTVHWAGKA